MTPYVVATLECAYAFRLTFCHSADRNRYAQIISGYVPAKIDSFFFYLDFLSRTFTIHRTAGAIYLTPVYHFHLLHRYLDISWAITAESSPQHIANSIPATIVYILDADYPSFARIKIPCLSFHCTIIWSLFGPG